MMSDCCREVAGSSLTFLSFNNTVRVRTFIQPNTSFKQKATGRRANEQCLEITTQFSAVNNWSIKFTYLYKYIHCNQASVELVKSDIA